MVSLLTIPQLAAASVGTFVLLLTVPPFLLRLFRRPKSPKGKVVVITGASSGIGEAIALEYAKRGAKLLLAARRQEQLQDVATRCLAMGSPQVETIKSDVSQEADCKALIDTTIAKFNALDVLVLNAGIGQSFFLERAESTSGWEQYMRVNYYGAIFPAYYALPHLRASNGQILVVSSVGGLVPFPRQTLYNATKHALNGFFDSLRLELGGDIAISMACPGFIKTAMVTGGAIGADGKPLGDSAAKVKHVLPMMTAQECASILVSGAMYRDTLIVTPWWYGIAPVIRALSPDFFGSILRALFVPKRRSGSKKAAKKAE